MTRSLFRFARSVLFAERSEWCRRRPSLQTCWQRKRPSIARSDFVFVCVFFSFLFSQKAFGFSEGGDKFVARFDAVFKKYEGKLVLFERHVCFLSEMFMTTTKRIYPLGRVRQVERRSDGLCLCTLSTDVSFILPQNEAGEAAFAAVLDLWQKCEKQPGVDMGEDGVAQDLSAVRAEDLYEQSQKEILTAIDWDLMLNGAKKVVYKDGEFIIRSGDSYQKIYHIIRGNCIVEVERDGQMIVINRMQENTTFGEMSFIKQTEDNDYKASANVVAVDEVEISIIEGYFLNILFDMHPGLEGRKKSLCWVCFSNSFLDSSVF